MLHPITTRDTSAYWSDLFNNEELDQILNLCKTLPLETGTIGNYETTVDDIRKSSVGWLTETKTQNGFLADMMELYSDRIRVGLVLILTLSE